MRRYLESMGLVLILLATARSAEPWGTILGRMVYDGKPPEVKNLLVNKDVIPGKEPGFPTNQSSWARTAGGQCVCVSPQ